MTKIMYVVYTNRLTTMEVEARLQLYLKRCKNGKTITLYHQSYNGSLDKFSACLAQINRMVIGSRNTVFKPLSDSVYNETLGLGLRVRWDQLQASERFTLKFLFMLLCQAKG